MISEHTVTVNDSSKKQDNKLSPEEILSNEDHDAVPAAIDTIDAVPAAIDTIGKIL